MRLGGTGGANTKTGLFFEGKVDLVSFLSKQKGYTIKHGGCSIEICYNGRHVATSFKKNGLYTYLSENGIDYEEHIIKKLLPDDVIFVKKNNTFFIMEMKFQKISGSVDEKLQTCDFKIRQYRKLLSKLRVNVEYVYILSDWFKKREYCDVLHYIRSMPGCSYYFNRVPLAEIGLPVPE